MTLHKDYPARARGVWSGNASIEGIRISKRQSYLLTYPDGSRKHIDRETRDSLELSRTIRKTGPDRYLFTAKPQTFHSFADLKDYAATHDFKPLRRFLEGNFIFELYGRKKRELLETPEAMALRICEQ